MAALLQQGQSQMCPCTCREAAEAMALLDAIVEGLVRHFFLCCQSFSFPQN